jgi:hypothetical protein
MSKYLAYCGSRCDICPRYEATIADDMNRLTELAELWFRCGWRDQILPPEEMKCNGCHPPIWCRYEIPNCAALHEVKNCGVCNEYESCATLQDMFTRNAAYKDQCEAVCSPEEFEMLKKTCFSKRTNLELARSEIQK